MSEFLKPFADKNQIGATWDSKNHKWIIEKKPNIDNINGCLL